MRPNFLPVLRFLAVCALATLTSACSTNSTIKHSYVDPLLRKLDLDGVLVIAVAQNRENRITFENMFVKALAGHGVNAIAAHSLLPKGEVTAEEVVAAASNNELDTVLVTRYIGANTEEIYHPGTIYYGVTPMYGAGYYGGFPGYYGHAYEVAYQQPVWTSNTTHEVIADLYVTDTQEHMWQAVSDTIKAGSTDKLRHDVIASLIGDLKDQGLLD
ncbi:hypothetical protein R0137_10115 [Congregibacter brevis]|uniref:DUF4136 domain-containing protein n=1 Tax=Congregibacter brevis TaxID=3081201 RepID=A0ABZ0I7V7_9GAMM|nr:hypothetical protein R0137_10115 [Congregibacter sp. IMCC45268]